MKNEQIIECLMGSRMHILIYEDHYRKCISSVHTYTLLVYHKLRRFTKVAKQVDKPRQTRFHNNRINEKTSNELLVRLSVPKNRLLKR